MYNYKCANTFYGANESPPQLIPLNIITLNHSLSLSLCLNVSLGKWPYSISLDLNAP